MVAAMKEAALRYAHLGLAVIPLKYHDKKPIFENWPEVATSNEDMVSRWWDQTPGANVGIATGQKSRLFVLDVDPKNGGSDSFDELIAKHGRFPDTWQQITGSGGFHLFFRYPSFPIRNAASIFPGIDIRGDGGQVVAPPSIHPDTGKEYTWDGLREIENTPLAEAPLWLLDMLQQRGQRTHSDKFPVAVQIPKGVQHETLVALAGMLRKLGLNQEEIFPSLMEVNRRRCTEPGPDLNIHKIAESMMRYRPDDKDLFSTANRLWRVTKARECEAARQREANQVAAIDGLTIYRTTTEQDGCVIDGLLYRGLTIFAGRPKSGKSWATLQMALSVAHGTKFLGRDVVMPGGVVYCALEEKPRRTAKRMRMVQGIETPMLQNIEFVYGLDSLVPKGAAQLDELLTKWRPSLVIIDTFLRLVGSPGERRDVMRAEYQEIAILQELSEKYQTAMVLVHHTRKGFGNETGLDAVAGTTGITAAADAVWTLKREDAAMCTLTAVGREIEEQSIGLRFHREDPTGWEAVGDGDSVRTAGVEKDLLMLLREEGAMSSSKAATMLRKPWPDVSKALRHMREVGLVNRQSNSQYCATASDSRRED